MAYDEQDRIRTWTQDGFTLHVYNTHQCDHQGKAILAYELFDRAEGEEPLFHGADFHCSPLHSIDADTTLAAILHFLSLRPADTDREHFDDYTARQLDWCQRRGETLGYLAWELEQPYKPLEHTIRHEAWDDAWTAGRYGRALELHYERDGIEHRLTIGAGYHDDISAFLQDEIVYVLTTNSGLGHVGLESWIAGDKMDDLFFRHPEHDLGEDVWELEERELLQRLEPYLQ